MLYAKLGKRDDCRIVCGACGNGVAWIAEAIFGKDWPTGVDIWAADFYLPVYRYVFIEEGWFPDNKGVWRPSNRARRQRQRGLPAQNRRLPKFHVKFWNKQGGRPHRQADEQYRAGFVLLSLPSEIVCLHCDMRQSIDGATLRAVPLAFRTGNSEEFSAALQRSGARPRAGLYPGAFEMPYRRVRDPDSRTWRVVSDLTRSYLHYLGERSRRLAMGDLTPIDGDSSAVAESS